MGLFGRKKAKTETNPAATAVQNSMQQVQETTQTQSALSQARDTKEALDVLLDQLKNDDEMFRLMKKSAQINQQKLDDALARFDAALQDTETNPDTDFVKAEIDRRRELYGGLQVEESETDFHYQYSSIFLLPEEMDTYINALTALSRAFKTRSTAEAVDTGADQLLDLTKVYVNKFREALANGQKLKANACIDMLRYVLEIGYRKEATLRDGDKELSLAEKKKFLQETGIALIDAIDQYYDLLAKLEVFEADYNPKKQQLGKDMLQWRSIPQDVQTLLNNAGFRNGIKRLPKNAETDDIIRLLMRTRNEYTQVRTMSIAISRDKLYLESLKNGIQTLIRECKMAFNRSGHQFDYAAHHKMIREVTQRIMDEAKQAANFATETQKLNEEINSMITEVEEDAQLGQAISSSMTGIARYAEMESDGQAIARQMRKNKAALERAQRQQKADDAAQRLKEQQELEAMEAEILPELPVEEIEPEENEPMLITEE